SNGVGDAAGKSAVVARQRHARESINLADRCRAGDVRINIETVEASFRSDRDRRCAASGAAEIERAGAAGVDGGGRWIAAKLWQTSSPKIDRKRRDADGDIRRTIGIVQRAC